MDILTLPLPPTLNNYYGCNGHVKYIKKEGKEYRAQVVTLVKSKGWDYHADVRLSVSIVIHFARHGANDLDNRMKGLLDALTHANVWIDDALIDDLHVSRGQVKKGSGGVVLMTVQAMDDI